MSRAIVILLGLYLATTAAAVRAQTPECVGDADGDGQVTVDEILTSVDDALTGCDLQPITIRFRGMVGERPFACGELYEDIGLGGDSIIPADFRFYLHGIKLIDAKGEEVPLRLDQDGVWQYQDVVLLDFEDKTRPCNQGTVQTNSEIHASAPARDYRGIRFTIGIPFGLNHADASTAPSPLNLSAMFWSWRGGYKFMRFDEARDVARFHLGSTGCVGPNPANTLRCGRLNEGEAYLADFEPTADVIVADLKQLFADSDLGSNVPDTVPGCESAPEDGDCDPIFRNIGINFANGLPDPSRQKFFRAGEPTVTP